MSFNEVMNLAIYYFNIYINFKEVPRVTEEDMPIIELHLRYQKLIHLIHLELLLRNTR